MGIGDGVAQGGTPGGAIVEGLAIPTPAAGAERTLTDQATIAYLVKNGVNANVTLGGNRVLNWTGVAPGDEGKIRIVQDGTGTRLITAYQLNGVEDDVKFGGGVPPTLTATIGGVDILEWYFDGAVIHLRVYALDSRLAA
jgi:hypothetical protein